MIGFKEKPAEQKTEPKTEDLVDKILEGRSPSEIERVKDNREFIKKIKDKPLPKGKDIVKVFGVRDVNLNAILKDNIWNRSIFTTDHLCRVVFTMRFEQIRKYLAKKRSKPFDMWFLVIIIIAVVAAIIIILVLSSVDFTKIKIF